MKYYFIAFISFLVIHYMNLGVLFFPWKICNLEYTYTLCLLHYSLLEMRNYFLYRTICIFFTRFFMVKRILQGFLSKHTNKILTLSKAMQIPTLSNCKSYSLLIHIPDFIKICSEIHEHIIFERK